MLLQKPFSIESMKSWSMDLQTITTFTLGEMGKHNVVITQLPEGEYGIAAAAGVARDMVRSFSNIRIGLMVGIGGGAPSKKHDIRLGDVVISAPHNGKGGLFQYDFGKTIQDQEFRTTGFLKQPPSLLRAEMGDIKAKYEMEGHQLDEAIKSVLERRPKLRKKYKRPDLSSDRLYQSHVVHPHNDERNCEVVCGDDELKLVVRCDRSDEDDNPAIHYGLIASANQVMKNALIRDRLAAEKDVLCFEMEAAGLMNHFPCLVIRGICDYSDSHKNKEWQGYAAMAAAAYAKYLLYSIPPSRVEAEKTILDVLSSVEEDVKQIRTSVQDIHYTIEMMRQHEDNQDRQAIIDWLSPVDYAAQQSDFISKWQKGTGEWLLKSHEFQQWLKQSNQTLFCPGMPGAGKTMITSMVIHYLHNTFRNDGAVGIAYLYCNFKRQDEQKFTDLVLSLLKQLVQEQSFMPNTVRELYDHHKPKRTRPSSEEILGALNKVATSYSRTFVIVDALDECQVSNECRTRLVLEMLRFQRKTGANLFATSRFIHEIESSFHNSPILEIRANDEDVQKYLDDRLHNFRSLISKDLSLQGEIKSVIAKAVDGMFLLAQLYVDSLAYKTTSKAIRLALKDLEIESRTSDGDMKSKALDHAYEQAMERINTQAVEFRELARQVLSWITFARRPLRTSELQHALAIEDGGREVDKENIPEIEDMVSVCAGLVVVDEKSHTIRLVHHTTQEYFTRNWCLWFPNVQVDITQRCVTYLLFDVFETGPCQTIEEYEARLQSNVLYDYAAQNWGYHAPRSLMEGTKQLILTVLESEMKVSACAQAIIISRRYSGYAHRAPTNVKGLHVAAYFGLVEPMTDLLKRQHDPESKDDGDQMPLHWAAWSRNEAIVELLLKSCVDPGPNDGGGRTPLHWAARHRHRVMVELLLDKGADPGPRDKNGRTPLLWVSQYGNTAIAKLLLDKGADPDCGDKDGQIPVHWASQHGHEAAVELLLDEGADPDCGDDNGQTPLHWAFQHGHEATAKLLLDKGADPDCGDDNGRTPLHWAFQHGHEATAKLLLDKGADPDCGDKDGQTPLHWAFQHGHEATAKLLLDKGADPDCGDDNGRTPLHWASRHGHEAIVKLLLDKGADPDCGDNNGRTSLHRAFQHGYETIVKLLLDKGADPDFGDDNGRTPLH
ncbi:hypothetical protein EYB26_008644 [Talaromyces marneffei]|uniref:uncharacterized protein n=1 Tax=Talaromyces marneffei TaxID=37727 RepID=UPI0012A8E45D|nr:uncharacterized protein EYB26_008644 [Talaromyces marneffei]QGA20934.1 hypothetical protein EYB26_008644 [Talaromyces marneffei]